jgi:hypothetical protein
MAEKTLFQENGIVTYSDLLKQKTEEIRYENGLAGLGIYIGSLSGGACRVYTKRVKHGHGQVGEIRIDCTREGDTLCPEKQIGMFLSWSDSFIIADPKFILPDDAATAPPSPYSENETPKKRKLDKMTEEAKELQSLVGKYVKSVRDVTPEDKKQLLEGDSSIIFGERDIIFEYSDGTIAIHTKNGTHFVFTE